MTLKNLIKTMPKGTLITISSPTQRKARVSLCTLVELITSADPRLAMQVMAIQPKDNALCVTLC